MFYVKIEAMLITIFWVSLIVAMIPVWIYPFVIFLLSFFCRPHSKGDYEPTVTLIISAYNEDAVIKQKIENALQHDYPSDMLDVMLISDGSTDMTCRIAEEYISERFTLFESESRLGKSSALTRFVFQAKGEILIFTDANSTFLPGAFTNLVSHFSDDKIGYVVGRQVYSKSENGVDAGESVYWNFELLIKEWESRVSSVVGGDGAILAMRRSLFTPLSSDDINDFSIPLRIVVDGYRGVFESDAICVEESIKDTKDSYTRKVRIVNRSMNAVLKNYQALNPFVTGFFAVQLLCHKVLRWLSPFFLLLALASSVALWPFLYIPAILYSALFCLAAQMGALFYIPVFRGFRIVRLCWYVFAMNLACIIASAMLARGVRISRWTPVRV